MKKEKEKFISYYDSKFKVGEKKKIKVDNSDEILEQPYMLGEFELFSIINPKGIVSNGEKLYYPIGIENSKKNIVNIIKFYFDKNLLKEKEEITNRYGKKLSQEIAKKEIESKLFKIKYDSIKDYILTLIYSGEKEENAIKYFIDNFTPEKIKVPELYGYQMMFNIIKESFSDQIFYNVVKSFKEKILNMGEQGKSLYNQLLNKLNIGYYEVAAGNKVMYSNSNDMSYYEYNWNLNLNKETISGGPIFLTDGRLYEVIETGDYFPTTIFGSFSDN
jgi:glutathione peroxidase-family protein